MDYWLVVSRRLLQDEDGALLAEYALLAALIAAVCVISVAAVGGNTSNLYNRICNAVATATGAPTC